MTAIKKWLLDMFSNPEVDPFIPEEDPFVMRTRDVIKSNKKGRLSQEHWQDRNALERELLGRRSKNK